LSYIGVNINKLHLIGKVFIQYIRQKIMKLEVNINKRYAIMIIASVLLLGVSIFVYAAIGDEAPNPGHEISEIAGFPDCANGEVLTHSDGVWSCIIINISFQGLTQNNCYWTEWTNVQNIVFCTEGDYVAGLHRSSSGGNDFERLYCYGGP